MSTRRRFAQGAGCLGALGLSGTMGIVGVLGLLGVGGWVSYRAVTSQWEDALRQTLAQTTGDEITFRKLSIGLRSVTVRDLEVRDDADGALLHVDALKLRGDPRELLGAPTAWHLDGLHLQGVSLRPQRDGDGFHLPQTTLALLRGETPLPEALALPRLVVPEVTVDGLSIELDGHRIDALAAHIADGVELVLPAEGTAFSATLGAAEATGVSLPDPDLRIDRLLAALDGPLGPDTTRLALKGVVAEGVGLELGELSALVPRVSVENDVVLDLLAGPSLVVGTLQSDGFRLTAGNVFHCRDVRARVAQPLTLASEEVLVDELVATGLRSETTRQGWPVTDVLLSATKGAALPTVRAPSLVFRDTTIEAGAARATAAHTATSFTFAPGERLAWGAGTVQGVQVTVGGAELLGAERVEVSGGVLVPGLSQLAFERLAAQGVSATSAWSDGTFGVPEALLGLAAVRGGMRFATVDVDGLDLAVSGRSGPFPVHLDEADVQDLVLSTDAVTLARASAGGVRLVEGPFEATVHGITSDGAVTLHPGRDLAWGPLAVRGLAVLDQGEARLAADQLDVPAGTLAADTARIELAPVAVRGLRGTLRWGEPAFGVPDALFRLGGFAGGVALGDVRVDGADVIVRGRTGALPVHVDRVTAPAFSLGPEGWSLPSAQLSGVETKANHLRATVRRVDLEEGGVVRLEGTEAWARVNEQRQLDLPPVAADHAPAWLGGQYAGGGPYFGVAFPGSPYVPTSVHAPGVVLHLADEGIASPHTTWDLPLQVTVGPHDPEGHLPVVVEGEVAGGQLAFDGYLEAAGTIRADVGVRGLVLGDLGMYLDEPMSRFGMEITQGRGGAALHVDLTGSTVSMVGQGTGRSLKMRGSALAGVANAGFGVVKGDDNTVPIPIAIDGDLADPAFSPFDLLLSSYVGGLHKSVAKSLGKAVKGIGGPEEGVARNKQTGGGRIVDKAFGALKGALKDGSDDAVRAGKEEKEEGPTVPTKLLDTAADTGRPERVDTGKEE